MSRWARWRYPRRRFLRYCRSRASSGMKPDRLTQECR
jgi:hypothetical protein